MRAVSAVKKSRLNSANSPARMDSRIAFIKSKIRVKLCKVSNRIPRISPETKRCRKYPRVKFVHAGHRQPEISGFLSARNLELRIFTRPPNRSKNAPCRASRVGITQSNMSIPRSTASRMSENSPTPIKYLGFWMGKSGATSSSVRRKSDFDSPTAIPPIATPGTGKSAQNFADCFRKSGKLTPCTMGKSACETDPAGPLGSARITFKLSSAHFIVRKSAVSATARDASAGAHSSNCITMSDPSFCCI